MSESFTVLRCTECGAWMDALGWSLSSKDTGCVRGINATGHSAAREQAVALDDVVEALDEEGLWAAAVHVQRAFGGER